jgi:sulfur carrier protein
VNLTVNGQSRRVRPETTVAALLEELGFDAAARGVAVAVNDAVVPKSSWPEQRLSEGDTVEIIHAVQGG